MARKKTTPPKPITSTKHQDKRANIPTEELRDFVAPDEHAPQTIRYPRDPSLDPQLVWQGKDEQDSENLAVPAVPVYIQEKIHPQAIVEDVRANLPSPPGRGAGGEGPPRRRDHRPGARHRRPATDQGSRQGSRARAGL